MRQHQVGQPSNGVRSQPESPSRGHGRKLSLDVPTADERAPSVARQIGHPQSPVSASTTTSQYQASDDHEELDADADTTSLQGNQKEPVASSDATLTESEEDESFFGGRMDPVSSGGYGLGSGFAAARAEAALVKERERRVLEEKARKRAELTRDLQLSLAQPMHSSHGSVSGTSVFGPYRADFFAATSSGRASTERMSTSAERPRSEGERERQQRQRHAQPRRGAAAAADADRFATPLKDRFSEGRPSLGDDPRAPASSASSTTTTGSKKLQRSGDGARRPRPSDDAPPARRTQPVPPPPPGSAGRDAPRRAGASAPGSSASSDGEGGRAPAADPADAADVTALPKIRPQRQRTRAERDRDRERERDARNPAAEKSLVDRLLSTASKKKKG